MSIFGKKTSGFGFAEAPEVQRQRKDTLDSKELPTLETIAVSSNNPQPPLVQKSVPPIGTTPVAATPTVVNATPQKEGSEVNKSPYTIEDVIRLMRELPDSKKEMVVIIVQKTLLSAKIDISSIIDDAGRKVDKLQRLNDKMVGEIRELEEAIIQKKGEVDRLVRDIEETNGVKQVFEVVYGRHVKSEQEAAGIASVPEKDKTIPPAAPTIKIF
ncbi:MAG: hypothetical protein EOP07_21445 [Proteobacteria bacterium]|nr:MAG: hypothetical protein EOP07_21445 [Pseudomonadota bacterium]